MNLSLNESLRDLIRQNLQKLELRTIEPTGQKHAAVALTIVDQREEVGLGDLSFAAEQADDAAILLTIRSASLKHHGGQRAFPGGRIDAGETIEQAALRELYEEVGLLLGQDQIIGRLDDYATRSGFVISPVVVWGGTITSLQANPAEVASIHRIPLSELLRDDAPILEHKRDREHPVLKMPIGNDWIAAPTAALAYQFREVALLARNTRVVHFDQPRFAWS